MATFFQYDFPLWDPAHASPGRLALSLGETNKTNLGQVALEFVLLLKDAVGSGMPSLPRMFSPFQKPKSNPGPGLAALGEHESIFLSSKASLLVVLFLFARAAFAAM